jgi:hypothetical protein
MKAGVTFFLSVALFFMALLLTFSNGFSQGLKESYERSALTVLFTSYGDRYEREIATALEKEDFVPDQFFSNPVSAGVIDVPQHMASSTQEEKEAFFTDYLQKKNTGKEIVAYWYNQRPGKGFDLSRLFERAEYNAIDEEVLVSRASIRGEARIRDFGSKLVQNSYVLVIDLTNIGKVEQEKANDPYGWEARMGFYLFKLRFGEQQSASLYDTWIYQDVTDSVRRAKEQLFAGSDYPLEPALKRGNTITSGMNYLAAIRVKPSFEELFARLLKNSVDNAINFSASQIQAFQVQTKIDGRRPISAKIGKKEGLKTDHRYFVYEYVWDEQAQEAVPKRKAVIRAKKVSDNRKKAIGTTIPSRFYQTYGGTVKEGMTLAARHDVGLSLAGSIVSEGLSGANLRAFYRTGPFTGIPSFYVVAGMGFDSREYSFTGYNTLEPDNFSFFRYEVGLGKGLRMFRLLEIMPYATYGRETVTAEDDDYAAFLIKGGLYGGLNLLHNVAVFGDVNWVAVGNAEIKAGEEFEETGIAWENLFSDEQGDGRAGGMAIELGLRFDF